MLLEYAEMDLNAVIKSNQWPDPILAAAYFWKEMVKVVQVSPFEHESEEINVCVCNG